MPEDDTFDILRRIPVHELENRFHYLCNGIRGIAMAIAKDEIEESKTKFWQKYTLGVYASEVKHLPKHHYDASHDLFSGIADRAWESIGWTYAVYYGLKLIKARHMLAEEKRRARRNKLVTLCAVMIFVPIIIAVGYGTTHLIPGPLGQIINIVMSGAIGWYGATWTEKMFNWVGRNDELL